MNDRQIQVVDASVGAFADDDDRAGMPPLELKALRIEDRGWGEGWAIESAPTRRPWMDEQPFTYQCPPLVVANQWGWRILCPADVKISWDGSRDRSGLTVEVDAERDGAVKSQFGEGIVTFCPPWLFRTSPGWDLYVKGPNNLWRPDAAPLEGLVETWWLPYTFTINWKIHAPGEVLFAKGEPIAQLIPVPHATFRDAVAVEAPISSDPAAQSGMAEWAAERDRRADAKVKTHHFYRKGEGVSDHVTKVGVPPFRPRP